MSGFDGIEAWLVYGLASLVAFVAWCALCSRIGSVTVRDVLRVLAFAAMVTPAPVPGYPGQLAPAWLVVLFETFLQREGDPLPAATLLVISIVALLAVVAGWRYFRSGAAPLPHRG